MSNLIKDLRRPRIHIGDTNIAVFDTVGTLGISYVISKKFDINMFYASCIAFGSGFVAHELTGKNTPLNKAIKDVWNDIVDLER
jgi:hypothetical protein